MTALLQTINEIFADEYFRTYFSPERAAFINIRRSLMIENISDEISPERA